MLLTVETGEGGFQTRRCGLKIHGVFKTKWYKLRLLIQRYVVVCGTGMGLVVVHHTVVEELRIRRIIRVRDAEWMAELMGGNWADVYQDHADGLG